MKRVTLCTITALVFFATLGSGLPQEPIKVVGSVPDFAALADEIGGDLVDASFIAQGNQDPHFVPPKPSLALLLADADLFIQTGIDLEMWAPPLIDKARNRNIMEGADGYVAVTSGIDLIDVHAAADRSAGDIHVHGNPHIQTCPARIRLAAANVLIGLQKVDPDHSAEYEQGYEDFLDRWDRALFGDELVDLLGGDLLIDMIMNASLFDFLGSEEFDGGTLLDHLGGWYAKAAPLRGLKIIAYHKNWSYFARAFGMEIVDFVEPKPGIPPTARHVKHVIDEINEYGIDLMLVANYFERNTPGKIEERTGVRAIFLPISVTGEPGTDTLFDLYDYWLDTILAAMAGTG